MADVNEVKDPQVLHQVMLKNIMQDLFQHYKALTHAINVLHIDEGVKHSILYSIGSGYLWARNCVEQLPLVQPQPQLEVVEPTSNAE